MLELSTCENAKVTNLEVLSMKQIVKKYLSCLSCVGSWISSCSLHCNLNCVLSVFCSVNLADLFITPVSVYQYPYVRHYNEMFGCHGNTVIQTENEN